MYYYVQERRHLGGKMRDVYERMSKTREQTQIEELKVHRRSYESFDHENVVNTHAGNDTPLEGSGSGSGSKDRFWYSIDNVLRP
jgi:hypothetical protein